jgi:hypothetical protein
MAIDTSVDWSDASNGPDSEHLINASKSKLVTGSAGAITAAGAAPERWR